MKKSVLFLAMLLAFFGMAMTGCSCCDDPCGDSCNTCDTCPAPCSPCGDTSYSGTMPPPPPPPATR